MAESNRRRLERLEQMAHVSVGDARIDVLAAIELEAQVLEAEIQAHKLIVEHCSSLWAFKHMAPQKSREQQMELLRRQQRSTPARIKEQFKELERRVREHGTTPQVQAILATARQFLEGAGVR